MIIIYNNVKVNYRMTYINKVFKILLGDIKEKLDKIKVNSDKLVQAINYDVRVTQ